MMFHHLQNNLQQKAFFNMIIKRVPATKTIIQTWFYILKMIRATTPQLSRTHAICLERTVAEILWLERCRRVHILQILKILQNEHLLANIGVDTAENEPSKVLAI